jgi:hypothetical protein
MRIKTSNPRLTTYPVYSHMKAARSLIMCCLLAAAMSGCTAFRVVSAWANPRTDFYACTTDARILCEPGSEKLAKQIAPFLPEAIETVTKAQYAPFPQPIVVYTYATKENFAAHSGAPPYAEGAVSVTGLNLSPKLLQYPERQRAILTHELSHYHLRDQLGTWAWSRLPGWFSEGLATYVSGGGGAETVTEQEAFDAINAGKRLKPEASQWALFPQTASTYGLHEHMFYRQAALFVQFMHDKDTAAFERMLKDIERKKPFAAAIQENYGVSLQTLWGTFIASVESNTPL